MNTVPCSNDALSPDELPPCLVDFFEKFTGQVVFFPMIIRDIISSVRNETDKSLDFRCINYLLYIFHPEDYNAFLSYTGLAVKNETSFTFKDGETVSGCGELALARGACLEDAISKLQKLKNFIEQKLEIANEDMAGRDRATSHATSSK